MARPHRRFALPSYMSAPLARKKPNVIDSTVAGQAWGGCLAHTEGRRQPDGNPLQAT